MEISVDGSIRQLDSPPETIGQLILQLKAEVSDTHKMVLSVSLDGAEIDLARQHEIAASPASDFSRLEFETTDGRLLCIATLEEAEKHIQPVLEEAARIADLLDAGKEAEAFSRILPCLAIWSTLIAAIQKCAALMDLDLATVCSGDTSLNDVVARLTDFLADLKSNIDAHDLVAVRDGMKFEMPEIAQMLSDQLSTLCSVVSSK